ncbi:hypothetical protein ACTXT7_004409 [Hymenolepis weldensis]
MDQMNFRDTLKNAKSQNNVVMIILRCYIDIPRCPLRYPMAAIAQARKKGERRLAIRTPLTFEDDNEMWEPPRVDDVPKSDCRRWILNDIYEEAYERIEEPEYICIFAEKRMPLGIKVLELVWGIGELSVNFVAQKDWTLELSPGCSRQSSTLDLGGHNRPPLSTTVPVSETALH